eukprot:6940997-Prorocentrum_lima.AAC.1
MSWNGQEEAMAPLPSEQQHMCSNGEVDSIADHPLCEAQQHDTHFLGQLYDMHLDCVDHGDA